MKLLTVTAALIYERSFTEAGESLARVTAEARAGGFDLVRGNCLELSAQLAIEMKDYAGAMNHLDLAEQRLRHTESAIERLWVLKWRAMAESLAPARVTESLMKVSALAASAGHWETVRHCELSGALINRDVNSLTRVFFGTPYANYRKRIVDDAGAWYLPPEIYTLDSGALNVRSIDLSDGHFEDGTTVVARGQIPHLLLIALSRDFYRPLPLVAAFAQLFPEEYFNAVSSPTRVHHAVRRLREALSAMETGMIIVHERGAYRLRVGDRTALRISRAPLGSSSRELRLLQILRANGAADFSAADARDVVAGSVSTVQRLLRWGLKEKKLTSSGIGKATRYRAAS